MSGLQGPDGELYSYSMHPGWAETVGARTAMGGLFKSMGNRIRSSEQARALPRWMSLSAPISVPAHALSVAAGGPCWQTVLGKIGWPGTIIMHRAPATAGR